MAAALVLLAAVGGCSPSAERSSQHQTGGSPATSTGPAASSSASTSATPTAGGTATTAGGSATTGPEPVSKLLVIVVENHSLAQMRAGMPWSWALARRYGYATDYRATRHPSLPNYLVMASGSTHGVADNRPPARHELAGATVFGRALAAGRTAAVYAEAMTEPCQLTSRGRYAVKHNPWPYFPAERDLCRRYNLPLTALAPAVVAGTLPHAGMVIPDLCNDAHDCSLRTADRWVERLVTQVQAGPDWRSGRLALVLTADEDDLESGNRVLTVVAHPSIHGRVVTDRLGHPSLARLYAEVTGTTPLVAAASAPSMATAFGLPLAG